MWHLTSMQPLMIGSNGFGIAALRSKGQDGSGACVEADGPGAMTSKERTSPECSASTH